MKNVLRNEKYKTRTVLHQVCAGRQENEVCSLLRFIGKHFADSNWQPILLEVLGVLIEIYSTRIGQGVTIHFLFRTEYVDGVKVCTEADIVSFL